MKQWEILQGDCLDVMSLVIPENSIDAIVTDPPYGIRFMGMAWDGADIEKRTGARRVLESHSPGAGPNGGHKSIAAEAGKYDISPAGMLAFEGFSEAWAREALRILKPGGHLVSFSSARTYHRMVCGIEAAGFEIREQVLWMFGSGFPKSHNGPWGGTGLKPAFEPICLARKPLIGTVAANWARYGTGALNIDACRVPANEALREGSGGMPCRHDVDVPRGRAGEATAQQRYTGEGGTNFAMKPGPRGGAAKGRWPANVIHDGSDEVLAAFPDAQGQQAAITGNEPTVNGFSGAVKFGGNKNRVSFPAPRFEIDKSASRFFYCAKASRKDRNEGCEHMDRNEGCEHMDRKPLHWSSGDANPGAFQSDGTDKTSQNNHPTVKPTDVMAYLCRLITPPGGLILDPFAGSGSTGKAAIREGFRFIGIEKEAAYVSIARARIAHELAK